MPHEPLPAGFRCLVGARGDPAEGELGTGRAGIASADKLGPGVPKAVQTHR